MWWQVFELPRISGNSKTCRHNGIDTRNGPKSNPAQTTCRLSAKLQPSNYNEVASLLLNIRGGESIMAGPVSGLLAHNVFFTLKDNSAAAKEKLVAACRK